MIRIRTFGKSFIALIALVAVTAAFAQTSDTTASVTSSNTLSMSGGGTISMNPSVATAASDSSTTLDYETNDGQTYKIQVDAATGGWTFTPSVTGIAANTYPVLSVDSVSAPDGTPGSGTIISSGNVLTTVDVLTGLVNVAGSATVTLGASVTQTVVAGSYNTTLTYTFVSP